MMRLTRRGLLVGPLAMALVVLASWSHELLAQEQISEATAQKYNEATTLISTGAFAEAKPILEQVNQLEPGFARAHFDLGFCNEQLGDYAAAANAYLKAYEADPENQDYGLSAGKAFYLAGQHDKSLETLEPLATADADDAGLWLQLGRTQEKLKMFDEASASVQKATTLAPEDADAHYELGSIEYDRHKKSKEYDLAITSYTKALELAPDHTNAFAAAFKLARMYYYLDQYDSAVEWYQKAIGMRPDYAPAYVSLGDTHAKRKDQAAAIAAYQQAIDLKAPEVYGMAYYKLAPVYFEQDEPEKAIAAYEKSLEDPSFRYADRARTAMASIQDYLEKKKKAAASGY